MFIGTLLKHGLQRIVTQKLSRGPWPKFMLMQPGIIGLLSLVRFSDCLLTPPTPCPKKRATVAGAVFRLSVNTPDSVPENKILIFVKEEVFGISDGLSIIDKDHPVMVEMFAQDIIGGTLPTPVCALFTRLSLRMR
jgi:hypothetical protein